MVGFGGQGVRPSNKWLVLRLRPHVWIELGGAISTPRSGSIWGVVDEREVIVAPR